MSPETKKNVLITGATGYLGTFLVNDLLKSRKYNLILLNEDLRSLDRPLPEVDVVVHLAGRPNSYKGPREDIMLVNYQGTINLVRKISKQCHIIFLSSDYVFRSDANKVYCESDPTDPETVYGRSKALAEGFLLSWSENITILRTSMLYGYNHPRRSNYFKFVFDHLSQGKTIELFVDVYSSPTYIGDLCVCIQRIMEERLSGVLHACGKEWMNRYELGHLICATKGFDSHLIREARKPPQANIPGYLRLRTSSVFEDDIQTSLKEGLSKWQPTSL